MCVRSTRCMNTSSTWLMRWRMESSSSFPASSRNGPVALALIRPGQLYAWKGPSLVLVDTRGACGEAEQLSGFYFREARFLRTLRLEINGRSPWPCEASLLETDALAFAHIYPQLTELGGG